MGDGAFQQAVFAIADALCQAAKASGKHGHTEAPQFGERVAEGFGHGGRDQRQIGCELADQFRKFIARVVHAQVHARGAEEAHAGATSAEQYQFDAGGQFRNQISQQVFTLAAVDPAQHQYAQAGAHGWFYRCDGRGPCRDAVRDGVRW